MARTKEFDPDAALQSALELFWRRGYEATSMADLVEHLGIGRASLYATFGSKHELYLRALDRYGQAQHPLLTRELSRPGPVLPAVRAVVRRFAAEATAGPTREQGCLVTNTAVELTPHDPAAARRVEQSWDHLETLLHSALVRAQAQGELPADRDPWTLARTLLVVLQGLRVVGKASADPARVRAAAEGALALLD
ncbi:TetR/AcrR family transcriptional regulator [Streptomyces sp. NPDC048192]|uniref:TetR/AcrR family transcriptional regulator n=1 Tax=Streptomyces sp. NPDC048192 TaxID=3365510 RepID=UPI003717AE54